MKEKFKGSGTTKNVIRQYDNFLTTKGFDYKRKKKDCKVEAEFLIL